MKKEFLEYWKIYTIVVMLRFLSFVCKMTLSQLLFVIFWKYLTLTALKELAEKVTDPLKKINNQVFST